MARSEITDLAKILSKHLPTFPHLTTIHSTTTTTNRREDYVILEIRCKMSETPKLVKNLLDQVITRVTDINEKVQHPLEYILEANMIIRPGMRLTIIIG